MLEAVEAAGFEGQVISNAAVQQVDQQVVLRVGGMTCGSCSSAVEKALQAVPGVRAATVSLMQGRAEVGLVPVLLLCRTGHPIMRLTRAVAGAL